MLKRDNEQLRVISQWIEIWKFLASYKEKFFGYARNQTQSHYTNLCYPALYLFLFLILIIGPYVLYLDVSLKPHMIIGGMFRRWLDYKGITIDLLLGRAWLEKSGHYACELEG